jgi:hypothetical protein
LAPWRAAGAGKPRADRASPRLSDQQRQDLKRALRRSPARKGVELANLAADTLEEVIAAAERDVQRVRSTHWLAFAFLRHCGLALW